MPVFSDRDAFLFSAYSAQGTSSALDLRGCADYAFVWFQQSGQSGKLTLQASPDLTAWFNVVAFSLTATQTGTAQLQGYYPYIRASAGPMYTGTGGETSGTATTWLHFSPGHV